MEIKSPKSLINEALKEIAILEFDQRDVVRNPLVSKIVEAYQENE